MNRNFKHLSQAGFSRRQLLKSTGLGLLGASACNWFPALADELADNKKRKRQCILLWMNGGPTQTDTFDMKPGHENGGEFKEVSTSVAGLKFSEHLPKLAKHGENLAVVRSLNTREGDHGRGTYLMRTGQIPGGPVTYPAIGASIAKELGEKSANLPNYVSITPAIEFNPAAFGPGFLGPNYSAATVEAIRERPPIGPGAPANANPNAPEFTQLGVDFMKLPAGVDRQQARRRVELWKHLQDNFSETRSSSATEAHNTVYQRALRVMDSDAAKAFDLAEEKPEVRRAYGTGRFGQGCLLARRLIERGVPFVEVSLDGREVGTPGWDTHQDNFASVRRLSEVLDAGWATLMSELKERGLLETTTILWMGEFGRTPRINEMGGRDHFPNAWSCVFGGGGIQGGQAYGKTSADGQEVTEGKVNVGDVLSTLCHAVGVDPENENVTKLGRPIRIVDEGSPIKDILV